MREYITERVKNTTRHFKFGNIDVEELEPTPEDINLQAVFKTIEKNDIIIFVEAKKRDIERRFKKPYTW